MTTARKAKATSAPKAKTVPDQIVPLGSLAFMRPTYLARSAWSEHVPFAFWLIEALRPSLFVELGTHYGVSYFAFCQALEKLDLGARTFAIDLWTGDEHSGLYGPEVFQAVTTHNNETYSHFSTLRKCSFDEANSYFLDGSIDLLHIDGLHTYESVKYDFETWLPKMSSSGVVVFHDTNVRERDFGVFRLFAELKDTYPTFEFTHGHGLGIVGVGKDQKSRMRRLFDVDEHTRRDLQALFSGLGRGCLDAQKLRMTTSSLAKVKSQLKAVTADAQKSAADVKTAAAARTQAEERVAQIEAEFARQQEAVNEAEQIAAALRADIEERAAEIQSASAAREQAEAHARQLEDKLAGQERSVLQAEEKAAGLLDTHKRQEARIRELEEEYGVVQARLTGTERQIEELQEERRRASKTIDATKAQLSDTEWRRGELQAIADEREQHVKLLNDKLLAVEEALSEAKEHSDYIYNDKLILEKNLEESCKKEEELRGELSVTQSTLAQRQLETEENAKEISILRIKLKEISDTIYDRDKTIEYLQDKIALLAASLDDMQEASRKLEERHGYELEEAETERSELQKTLTSRIEALTKQLETLKRDSDQRVRERFDEIAGLTRLLSEREARAVGLAKELDMVRQESVLNARLAAQSGGARDALGRQSWEVASGYGTVSGLELGKAILKMIELPALWRLLPVSRQRKRQRALLERSGLFDATWYLNEYKDVAAAGIDPIDHYIQHGASEGREPNGSLATARRSLSGS